MIRLTILIDGCLESLIKFPDGSNHWVPRELLPTDGRAGAVLVSSGLTAKTLRVEEVGHEPHAPKS
jgi:hypothetical protein